jgi:hypothetical protein
MSPLGQRDAPGGESEGAAESRLATTTSPDIISLLAQATLDGIRADHGWNPLPPATSCPWCGAGPREPCVVRTRSSATRHRRPHRLRSTPTGSHFARAA